MSTMRAITVGATGLELSQVPIPVPGPRQVLTRVRAAGLNRAELAMSAGRKHGGHGGAQTPIGLEWSGVVEAVGSEVTGVEIGQRVMCTGGGAYADFAVTDVTQALPIPEGLTFEVAASLPIALRTMHNAVVGLGVLKAGESVLVHGASSGVGLIGMQVAREMGAGLIIGTSTNAGRRARLAEFGAHLAVDSREADWPARVLDATGGKGVDLVIDLVAGATINKTMNATAILGRIINNGRLAGDVDAFDFLLHATRRLTYIGSSFRTRTVPEIAAIVAAMQADLWPAVAAGRIALPIDAAFPMERAADAQAHMAANKHFGKIILTM
ncbi:MAG TPA: zinc-binding dehydrogenase [Stellaceae bacterium]|jgi:NADPH2:quinone reductase|nr:zinc-binding dehydrogenase [Stellaceae bacterium]